MNIRDELFTTLACLGITRGVVANRWMRNLEDARVIEKQVAV